MSVSVLYLFIITKASHPVQQVRLTPVDCESKVTFVDFELISWYGDYVYITFPEHITITITIQ